LSVKRLGEYEFVGELSLGGDLRPVRGSLPNALHCARAERSLVVPRANADEAATAGTCTVLPADHLLEVCGELAGESKLQPQGPRVDNERAPAYSADLSDVKGQPQAKRALEVAAAGEHNLLMIGPPGTGKTMLASRLATILPPLTAEEALESAAVRSISDEGFDADSWGQRGFRAPHHTASAVALVGGGSTPRPGEISLAQHGVLFLDELPEYERRVLDVLREPMERGRIVISRAARQAEFPARFQLIAAMNPCPCGYLGDSKSECRCTTEQVSRYRNKISGPVLDRIDLHVNVPRLPPELLEQPARATESSETVRRRVIECRQRQLERAGAPNARITHQQIRAHCVPEADAGRLLHSAIDKLGLSARAYDRILKLARTIADLDGSEPIRAPHVSEAIGYRTLDR
jgi:magnesium chelatase family protein